MQRGDLLVVRGPGDMWGREVGDPTSTRGPCKVFASGRHALRHSRPLEPGTPLILIAVHDTTVTVLHEGLTWWIERTWVKRSQ